jgi:hypothetical protein
MAFIDNTSEVPEFVHLLRSLRKENEDAHHITEPLPSDWSQGHVDGYKQALRDVLIAVMDFDGSNEKHQLAATAMIEVGP